MYILNTVKDVLLKADKVTNEKRSSCRITASVQKHAMTFQVQITLQIKVTYWERPDFDFPLAGLVD